MQTRKRYTYGNTFLSIEAIEDIMALHEWDVCDVADRMDVDDRIVEAIFLLVRSDIPIADTPARHLARALDVHLSALVNI